MEKCLVTKLNATVDNDDLNVLGALKLKFDVDTTKFMLHNTSKMTITLKNCTATIQGKQWTNTSFESLAQGSDITLNKVDRTKPMYITMSNKYTFSYVTWKDAIDFNLEELWCNNITSIDIYRGNTFLDCNLEIVLKSTTNLRNFKIEDIPISGNISFLSKFVNLTDINIVGTKITGSLESLAQGLFTNGKNSGTVKLNNINGLISFNNRQLLTVTDKVYLIFSSNSVSVSKNEGGSEIIGTYTGGIWSY